MRLPGRRMNRNQIRSALGVACAPQVERAILPGPEDVFEAIRDIEAF
jgi:hypothetical protein